MHPIPATPAPTQTRTLSALLSPLHPLANLWAERRLIRHLVRREVAARYRGSVGGTLWAVVLPLVMLATYTFVFSEVFESRFGGESMLADSKVGFALMLYAGLALYTVFQETVGAAPALILSNTNYVKRVVFPLEVLPVVKLAAAVVNASFGLAVLVVAAAVLVGGVSPTLWMLPAVLVPLTAFTLGVAWFLASLGVYLRDVGQVVQLALTILFFLTPIFYPVERLPPRFHWVMRLNPLTVYVESARAVLLEGRPPHWLHLGLATLASLLVMQTGYAWFMKTKRGFADVV